MSGKQAAGAFDVRNVIAALIGLYGVVLLVVGLLDGAEAEEKTGGIDANLWAGLVMLVVGLAFAAWSRLRPIVVDPAPDAGSGTGREHAGRHGSEHDGQPGS